MTEWLPDPKQERKRMEETFGPLLDSLLLAGDCQAIRDFAQSTPDQRMAESIMSAAKNQFEFEKMTPNQRIELYEQFMQKDAQGKDVVDHRKYNIAHQGEQGEPSYNYEINVHRTDAQGNIGESQGKPIKEEDSIGIVFSVVDKVSEKDYGSAFLSKEQVQRDLQEVSAKRKQCNDLGL